MISIFLVFYQIIFKISINQANIKAMPTALILNLLDFPTIEIVPNGTLTI